MLLVKVGALSPPEPADLRGWVADHEERLVRLERHVGIGMAEGTESGYGVVAGPAGGAGASTFYVVRRGDTLSGIARRFGTTVDELAGRNGIDPADPLRIGDRLVVAGSATGPEPATGGSHGSGVMDAGDRDGTVHHEIQRGETLFSIARRHGTTVRAIQERNGIADPALVWAGQVIRIGPSAMPAAPAGVEEEGAGRSAAVVRGGASSSSPSSGGDTRSALGHATHTVDRGETLSGIARRYGTTSFAIQSVNGIRDPDRIRPGQRLRLPTSAVVPEEPEPSLSGGTREVVSDPPSAGGSPAPAATVIVYDTIEGDTVESIAERFDISPQRLRSLNEIPPGGEFPPGQRIRLPADSIFATAP